MYKKRMKYKTNNRKKEMAFYRKMEAQLLDNPKLTEWKVFETKSGDGKSICLHWKSCSNSGVS